MKKRIASFLLVLILVVNLTPLSGCGQTAEEREEITRGEWIILLGNEMGMSDYVNAEPYYSDVTQEAPAFPYVQSCKEWGVLAYEEGDAFHPDAPATKEFMAVTAALAASAIDSENTAEEDVLSQAVQLGILDSSEDLSDGVLPADAQDMANAAAQAYLDSSEGEIAEVDFADTYVELPSVENITVSGSTVIMPADAAKDIVPGSVFVVPGDAMNPFGVAVKATAVSVQNDVAVIQTVEPDLGEIFDSYKVYGSGIPEMEGAQLADGVTAAGEAAAGFLSASGEAFCIDNLTYTGEAPAARQTAKGISLSFKINFTKGTFSVSPEWDNHKVTIERLIPPELRTGGDIGASPSEDLGKIFEGSNFSAPQTITLLKDADGNPYLDKNGMEKVLTVTDKYKGGYNLTGSISLNNVYVETGFEFKKVFGIPTGIKRVAVETNYESTADVSLKGKVEEELTIATLPIPVAAGLSVEMELILYAEATGEIQVRLEAKNNTKFEYSEGNLKKVTTKDGSSTLEAAVEAEAGVAPAVVLKTLGISIIDAKLKVGVHGEASASLQYGMTLKDGEDGESRGYTLWGQCVLKTEVVLPVIKLEVGTKETLANKLSITGKWTLVSKDDAPIRFAPEALNKKWTLFEVEILLDSEEAEESFQDTENGRASDIGLLDLTRYTVSLQSDTPYQMELDLHGAESVPDVIWQSDAPGIASVDDNGLITPHEPGTARITVSLKDDPDISVTCVVYVTAFDESNWEFLPANMVYRI